MRLRPSVLSSWTHGRCSPAMAAGRIPASAKTTHSTAATMAHPVQRSRRRKRAGRPRRPWWRPTVSEAGRRSRIWAETRSAYNLVLLAALCIFTIAHYADEIALSRRKRRRHSKRDEFEGSDGASSSSTSTVEGTSTPPDHVKNKVNAANDSTPLLSVQSLRRKRLGIKNPTTA